MSSVLTFGPLPGTKVPIELEREQSAYKYRQNLGSPIHGRHLLITISPKIESSPWGTNPDLNTRPLDTKPFPPHL